MKKVAWFIPSFIEGSGGYRTIFQHINYMAGEYSCDVYVCDVGDYKDDKELTQNVTRLFGECQCRFYLGFHKRDGEEYDILIATAWLTAYVLKQYPDNCKKLYFVQDFEPMFYPVGDTYLKAANTYHLGFGHITIGRWLSWKLQREYLAKVKFFDFCADKSIYKTTGSQREKAVCFIYQPEKSRRCTELGMKALYIVKRIMPEVQLYFYGSNEAAGLPMDYVNKGIITPARCNELYNQCQVGLCISATNPSRIPFEMMSAGLPVVDIYLENNLFDYPEGGIMLAQSSPEAIAQAILNILADSELQAVMSHKGQEFMHDKDIAYAMNQYGNAVSEYLDGDDKQPDVMDRMYNKAPILPGKDLLNAVSDVDLEELFKNDGFLGRMKRKRWVRKIPGIKKMSKLVKNA